MIISTKNNGYVRVKREINIMMYGVMFNAPVHNETRKSLNSLLAKENLYMKDITFEKDGRMLGHISSVYKNGVLVKKTFFSYGENFSQMSRLYDKEEGRLF